MPRARHVLLPLIAVLSLLTVPAAATAQSTNAPPGNSAIDEYLETVPGVSGNVRPKPPAEGGGPTLLTPAQRAELDDRGDDGRTLARVVEATAPPPRASTPDRAPPSQSPAAAAGRSPVAAALAATTGTDDRSALGLVLPAILLASLVGVVALVVTRRRRQT